jgi:hypothetical protein
MRDVTDNAYQYFDFPTVRENMYRSRTAINRPLTGRNRREREEDVYISDYRVWTETGKGEELICKEKSVNELIVLVYYYYCICV